MIKIAKAENQADLEQCMNVRREVFTIERGVPSSIEVDEYDVLDGACDHFLISHHGKALGAFRCMRLKNNAVRLQRLCVLKDFRGTGMGGYALRFLEEFYSEQGMASVELDAKFEAVDFYKKSGYLVVSEKFFEAGIPHVKMSKALR